jgi:peptidoglycan hydrolase-like protein with peptidoglycan-binding domain
VWSRTISTAIVAALAFGVGVEAAADNEQDKLDVLLYEPKRRRPASRWSLEQGTLLSRQSVKSLQRMLKREGYYKARVDGIVGPVTKRALMQFQRDRNLPATGRIDLETFRVLDYALFRQTVPVRGDDAEEAEEQAPEARDEATATRMDLRMARWMTSL